MAGIAGIITPRLSAQTRAELDDMVQRLRREPSASSGTIENAALGIGVGWVSDAGSFADCLPVWNEQKNIALVFAGEEFADAPELEELRLKGHTFEPGNGSYLVHQYEEYGPDFFSRLNGGFSGVLLDLREPRVVLFNDRFGLNRIYWHENENGFYFASEAKCLLKVLPDVRQFDLKSLGEYFACGCVLQNRTLFRGVSLLPAGSAWKFASGRPAVKQPYFRFESWEQQPQLDSVDYFARFKEVWRRILRRYFRGRERIGLSLTGGVDSRMILAWAPGSAGTLPCYTFGGRYRECADVRISRQVADICGQKHEVITAGPEFLLRFAELAEKAVYLSDGGMDVTGAIDLYLQERARQIAPVRITGTNGGEILRSLVAFKPGSLCQELLEPELARHGRQAAHTYAGELQCHPLSFTAFKQAPWFMSPKFVLERSQVTLRMPYFDNELISLVYQAPRELAATNDFSRRVIADGNPALARVATDRGGSPESAPAIARAQRLLHEFSFRAEYAYDYGMPQWLARLDHLFAPLHLERLFLGRHKIHHFRVYYRDELAAYLKAVLLDPRALGRSHLRNGSLPEIVQGHLKGVRNHTMEIHRLLTLELIQRQLLEQN